MTQQSRTPIGNRSRSITNSACWRFWIQPGQNSSQPCGTSTWKMVRVLFWSSLSLHQPPLTNWQNCIDKSWESRTRVRWVDTILYFYSTEYRWPCSYSSLLFCKSFFWWGSLFSSQNSGVAVLPKGKTRHLFFSFFLLVLWYGPRVKRHSVRTSKSPFFTLWWIKMTSAERGDGRG